MGPHTVAVLSLCLAALFICKLNCQKRSGGLAHCGRRRAHKIRAHKIRAHKIRAHKRRDRK